MLATLNVYSDNCQVKFHYLELQEQADKRILEFHQRLSNLPLKIENENYKMATT